MSSGELGATAVTSTTTRAAAAPSSFENHRYGVRTAWRGGPHVRLAAPGKPHLDVASAALRDSASAAWSPEELLIASLASCFELAILAAADAEGIPLRSVRVDATGHVQRTSGRYRVALVELDAHVETDAGRPDVERIAALASEACLVANALDVPVRTRLTTDVTDVPERARPPRTADPRREP